MKNLDSIQRQTLGTDVYEELKDLLISGQMVPGEKISLRPTAEKLKVSIMPVREAIHRLIAERALVVMPNRSIRVPILTRSQFEEVTKIRIQLEGWATFEAAQKMNKKTVGKIRILAENFSSEMNKDEPNGMKLVNLNKELHFTIYKQSQMPTLIYLIEELWLRIGPILNFDLQKRYRKSANNLAVDNHHNLVIALQNADYQQARIALQADIESAAEYIMSSGHLLSN